MPARLDLVQDPDTVRDLAQTRLGTAFFRRALAKLSDAELAGPSLLPGWSRRHVVAHAGYNARALARLVSWAATNTPTPMYASPEAREEEIRVGATLNPEALRNLVDHAAIDLDVRWRDLPADRWNTTVVTAQGRDVPVSETVWMRSREVWLHAVDLDSGARIQQVPTVVLTRLLSDIHQAWAKRLGPEAPCLTAIDDGNRRQWGRPPKAATHVEGPLSSLAAWAAGRMPPDRHRTDLVWVNGASGPAPRWL